jgi:hypothetical protein
VLCQVLLLTYDRANRERALKEGLQAMTLTAFVEKHKPDALDLLAVPEDSGCVTARGASPSEGARNTWPGNVASSLCLAHIHWLCME